MIIFGGWGMLVPAMLALCFILAEVAGEKLMAGNHGGRPHFVAFLLGGVGLWLLGRYLQQRDTHVEVDPLTGEKMVVTRSHFFGFFGMRTWAVLFVLFGFAILWGQR